VTKKFQKRLKNWPKGQKVKNIKLGSVTLTLMAIIKKDIDAQNLNDLRTPLIALPTSGDHVGKNLGRPFLGFNASHKGQLFLGEALLLDDFLPFYALHE